MKELLLVRHGLPHEGHPASISDPPLHPLGRRHARRLAQVLARMSIDRIVASPQRRALETAAPLARLLAMPVEIVEGLAEVDRHVERYRSIETIRAEEPERWAEFIASPARFLGRDPEAYRRDVVAAFEAILADERGRRIAVFSHGMTIKTLVGSALGMTGPAYNQFVIAQGSVSRVSGERVNRLRIDSLNESLCAPVRGVTTSTLRYAGARRP